MQFLLSHVKTRKTGTGSTHGSVSLWFPARGSTLWGLLSERFVVSQSWPHVIQVCHFLRGMDASLFQYMICKLQIFGTSFRTWKFWTRSSVFLPLAKRAFGTSIDHSFIGFTVLTVCSTVVFPEAPDIALKLSVGIRVSSALRTISHFTANFGPRFSRDVVPKLAIDPSILSIEQEVASAVCARDAEGVDVDPDIAKHFTVVIRKLYIPDKSEAIIICAALLETGHAGLPAGIPIVQHIMGLDSQEKRFMFFHG